MEIKTYQLGATEVIYLISDSGKTGLLLLPADCHDKLAKNWELGPGQWSPRAENIREWRYGSLVQLHLHHHARGRANGQSMKFSESTEKLRFVSQKEERTAEWETVTTVLRADEGYEVVHTLGRDAGSEALWCETEFRNTGASKPVMLELLTSFCLEDLSPFQLDNDQTGKLALHRFYGSWALEGKHVCVPIEELGLQKGWGSAFPKGERFGSVGSWTCHRYFPTAAVEDTENGFVWAVSLESMSSWQMELSRDGDTLSFSGGLSDVETGAWMKRVEPGESFTAPRARIAVVQGDIQDACQRLLEQQELEAQKYGEDGMPIVFNEYCSSWGNPTQEKELLYAEIMRGKGIKYLVIDAGWSLGSHEQWGNGEWIPDPARFSDMKEMNRRIREMGMVPGLWFEFEVTTDGSKVFGPEYDHMHLKREGEVIRFGTDRSFWDFRNPETVKYLTEHVIKLLKDNDFGYMKVDYNGNIGLGCDGAESLGEGLRQQMAGVKRFFEKIKREVPGIVIENCASGGHRMEATMMSVTALTSFSDAHEAREIPVIAGNLQSLCIPKQNLIWAVLRADDSRERLEYSMAAGFLGRLCLSGDIERLSEEQWAVVDQAIRFYQRAEQVLLNGKTRVFREGERYTRHPEGLQAVLRENGSEALIVVHGFASSPESCKVPLAGSWKIVDSYGHGIGSVENGYVQIRGIGEWTALAIRCQRS